FASHRTKPATCYVVIWLGFGRAAVRKSVQKLNKFYSHVHCRWQSDSQRRLRFLVFENELDFCSKALSICLQSITIANSQLAVLLALVFCLWHQSCERCLGS